jgi:hypothetical protein
MTEALLYFDRTIITITNFSLKPQITSKKSLTMLKFGLETNEIKIVDSF